MRSKKRLQKCVKFCHEDYFFYLCSDTSNTGHGKCAKIKLCYIVVVEIFRLFKSLLYTALRFGFKTVRGYFEKR